MTPPSKLQPYRGVSQPGPRVSVAGATAGPPADTLRPSGQSFMARVKCWLGMDLGPAAHQANLLDRLRPPSTGRLSFFFGRLSKLSGQQYKLAMDTHIRLREGAAGDPPRAAEAVPIPQQLLRDFDRLAKKKPDGIFNDVCQLWRTAPPAEAAHLQQAVLAFLRQGPSHQAAMLAISAGLRQAAPRQSSAQVNARAQAIFAALVGSARHYADANRVARGEEVARAEAASGEQAVLADHPLDVLGRQLAALGQGTLPADLLERARGLAGLQAGLDELRPAHAQDARFSNLQSGCDALQQELTAAVEQAMRDAQTAIMDLPLQQAVDRVPRTRKDLRDLCEAADSLRDWPGEGRQACQALAGRLGGDLDEVARSDEVLRRYDAIERPDASAGGAMRTPCATLALHLRSGTANAYCAMQSRIERICALADPSGQADLLAALGVGLVSGKDAVTGKDKVSTKLLDDLLEGDPQAVDRILAASQWDDVARALRLGGVAAREQAVLAKAGDDKARADRIVEFARERFAVEILQERRRLNTEINRLLARKDPAQRGDLLGPTGAMTGANDKAIDTIRTVGGDLGREVDVVLAHWIYCSCLDHVTLAIDSKKATDLWTRLKGKSAQLPGLDDVQRFMGQGFSSFEAIDNVHKRIKAFSRLVADAVVLGKASHGHDPLVRARGLVSELHERLTGEKGIDPAGAAFAQRLKERVDAAREAWIDAATPLEAARIRKLDERSQLLAALQGARWKFALDYEKHFESTVNSNGLSRDQLQRVVECLVAVEYVNEQLAHQPAGNAGKALDFTEKEFRPKARTLTRFNPVELESRSTDGFEPEFSQMRDLLPFKGQLERLLNVDRSVSVLSAASEEAAASPAALKAAVDLQELTEGIARIAVLQEAIASGESPAAGAGSNLADGVLRRLGAFGVGVWDPVPVISGTANEARARVSDKRLDMGIDSLCKRLDPVDPFAPGVVRARLTGMPVDAPGVLGLVERAQAHLKAPALRRHRDNLHAVVQRFAALQAGQSFDIHIGRRGEFTVGYPVLPGVSASAGVVAGLANGIRISRSDENTYVVDVVGTKSASMAGGLSVLAGVLAGSAQRGASDASGYRITCESPQKAVELMEALVGMRQLKPDDWSTGHVTQLGIRAQESRASLKAEFALSSSSEDPLFKLEAEVDRSSGTSLEVTQSPFIRTERRTHTRAWHASASVEVLEGRFKGDAGRGAKVSVTRSCTRRGGLVHNPALAVRAQVVTGDVRGCLKRAMPHVAGEELEHFARQVEQAMEAVGEDASSVEVELQCAMTQTGLDKANQTLRLAEEWLQAQRRDGTDRSAQMLMALREADRALRDPSHYQIRGVELVVQSSVDAIAETHGPIKDTARVGSEQRQALTPPASGGGVGQLLSVHAGYERLLEASPA